MIESKAFTITVLSLAVIVSFAQVIYSEALGTLIVRSLPSLAPALRRFYDLLSFGQPWDGRFWNAARRIIGLASGFVFLLLIGLMIVERP